MNNLNKKQILNWMLENLDFLVDSAKKRECNIDVLEIIERAEKSNELFLFLANEIPNVLDERVECKNQIICEEKYYSNSNSLVSREMIQFGGIFRKVKFCNNNTILNLKLKLQNIAQSYGFSPVLTNSIVSEKELLKAGLLPKFKNDLWHLTDSSNKITNLFLTPTAEVGLVNSLENSLNLNQKIFSLNLSAFRQEGGGYGKRDKYIRLNEFFKQELVVLCENKNVFKQLRDLIEIPRKFLSDLQISHRIQINSFIDTSHTSCITMDLLAWSPSKERYIEICSASDTGFYQTMRLNIKQPSTLLNCSFFPLERLVFTILDNGYECNF